MSRYALSLFLTLILGASSAPASGQPDGAGVFQTSCYSCHHSGSGQAAPDVEQLHRMTQDSILRALQYGRMKEQGSKLTADELSALVQFLGTAESSPVAAAPSGACPAAQFSIAGDPSWSGWGADVANSRFQPGGKAGLSREQVPRL